MLANRLHYLNQDMNVVGHNDLIKDFKLRIMIGSRIYLALNDCSIRGKAYMSILWIGIFERAKIRAAFMLADSNHIYSPVIIIMPYSSPVLIMDCLFPIGRLCCIRGLLVHILLSFMITKVVWL